MDASRKRRGTTSGDGLRPGSPSAEGAASLEARDRAPLLGLRRDIHILIDDVSWARYGDRQKFSPFGLFGGKEGGKGQFVLNPGTDGEQVAKSKGLDHLNAGDVVSLRLPGAGGYASLGFIWEDGREMPIGWQTSAGP